MFAIRGKIHKFAVNSNKSVVKEFNRLKVVLAEKEPGSGWQHN